MTYLWSEYSPVVTLVAAVAIGIALWALARTLDTAVVLVLSAIAAVRCWTAATAAALFRRKWLWIVAASLAAALTLAWIWMSMPPADPMESREAKDCERLLSISERGFERRSEDYRRSDVARCVLQMRGVR